MLRSEPRQDLSAARSVQLQDLDHIFTGWLALAGQPVQTAELSGHRMQAWVLSKAIPVFQSASYAADRVPDDDDNAKTILLISP
jgi:hypothetical protein